MIAKQGCLFIEGEQRLFTFSDAYETWLSSFASNAIQRATRSSGSWEKNHWNLLHSSLRKRHTHEKNKKDKKTNYKRKIKFDLSTQFFISYLQILISLDLTIIFYIELFCNLISFFYYRDWWAQPLKRENFPCERKPCRVTAGGIVGKLSSKPVLIAIHPSFVVVLIDMYSIQCFMVCLPLETK